MSENWAGIAAEVDAALKSVGSTDTGYPVALRKVGITGGVAWDPSSGTPTITYSTLYGIEDSEMIRDVNGTVIRNSMDTVIVSATGAVPAKGDKVAPGVASTSASESTAWREIEEVRPLAPAGIAIMYELDLVT